MPSYSAATAASSAGHWGVTAPLPTPTSSTSTSSYGNPRNTASAASAASVPSGFRCLCGMDAVPRTVMKDGPNKGRDFYVSKAK